MKVVESRGQQTCNQKDFPWLPAIPNGWKLMRLQWTVASIKNGVWGSDPDGVDDIPCVRVADFDRNRFLVLSPIPTTRSVSPSERKGRVLRKNDLLIEKSGGGELQPVGAVVLYDYEDAAVCSNFIAKIESHPAHCPRFLCYLHAYLYASKVNVRSIKQTTGIQNLDAKSYFREIVPIPPLESQKQIADFLDRKTAQIDALITKKERLIALLKKKRQAKIAKALTKGLDSNVEQKPSGIGWLGMIPQHWEVVPIGYVSRSQGGSTPSKENIGYWNGDIPWVSPKDMKVDVIEDSIDHVTEDALSETTLKLIDPPVVLVVVRGMILAHTFPVGLTSRPVTINQDMKAIRPVKRLRAEYLSWLLRSISPTFFAIVEESGHGTRVLRTDLWSKQKIFVPPLSEQKEIVDYVLRTNGSINSLIEKVSLAISKLRSLRSALITAAVTGRIDVTSYRGGTQCQ